MVSRTVCAPNTCMMSSWCLKFKSCEVLVEKAEKLVCEHQRASTSFIQRGLEIPYYKAEIIMKVLVRHGVVSQPNQVGKRDVLLP